MWSQISEYDQILRRCSYLRLSTRKKQIKLEDTSYKKQEKRLYPDEAAEKRKAEEMKLSVNIAE